MSTKLTTAEFINRSEKVNNYKYDYSKVNYKNNHTMITIICPEHGEFNQIPLNHIKGHGCAKCAKNKSDNLEDFIFRANKVHGNKYLYHKAVYINSRTKLCITCPEHGDFWQTPDNHINKKSICAKCAKKNKPTNEEFIDRCILIHGDMYGYDKTNYVDAFTKVIITCPIHGDFKQTAKEHSQGKGCPICRSSKGERKIFQYLKNNKIIFIRQKKFKNCTNEKNSYLPFDFFLPNLRVCVEYDGEQHYDINNYWFSKSIKIHDEIKNIYCKNNDIKLIRIPYWDFDNIKQILDKELGGI